MEPRIAVVVAAYQPGAGFDRVMESIDAQTMPTDQFELIVVDDGSPDDTFERISALAASRPFMRVERIENSGWPSRPRNIGTDLARAPYVLYMDHDDSLYPDALRRLAEYAEETGADVVSAKESQTRSLWWGTMPFRYGNDANVLPSGDIHRLMPMIPHKLYRRAFLAEHGIRFPEGRRQLWEDIVFNVAAWRHAKVIALLADTPAYLWRENEGNNSSTYGPSSPEFWKRMADLMEFIDATLDGPDFARANLDERLHQWRDRASKRFSKLCGTAEGERVERALPFAQAFAARWVGEDHDDRLGIVTRTHTALTRRGETGLLGRLWRQEQDLRARVTTSGIAWVDGVLEARVEGQWVGLTGRPIRVLQQGDRLVRDLPQEILAAVPAEAVDVTDSLDSFFLRVAVHSKAQHVTWEVPVEQTVEWRRLSDGAVTPVATATVRIDPGTLAGGRPLEPDTWELSGNVHWSDTARSQGLKARFAAKPVLVGGRPVVAYSNRAGTLALDLSGSARNAVGDGGMKAGRVGSLNDLVVPLPRVRAWRDEDVPVRVHLEPVGGGGAHVLEAVLRSRSGAVELRARGSAPAGRYRVAFAHEGGVVRYGRWRATVGAFGRVVLRDSQVVEPPAALGRAQAFVRRAIPALRRRWNHRKQRLQRR